MYIYILTLLSSYSLTFIKDAQKGPKIEIKHPP